MKEAFRLCSTCAVGFSTRGNSLERFAAWDFLLFFFPPFRWAGQEGGGGGVSGCTWCCVPEGFLPSRWISVQREGMVGGGVSLDSCLLLASALPPLQLLRELGRVGLLVRSGLPLPTLLPRLSLPVPRRTFNDVGNWWRLWRPAPSCYPLVVPDLRVEEHGRIRELVHGRIVLVTVAVVLALAPLPVCGQEVESVGGGHRRGRSCVRSRCERSRPSDRYRSRRLRFCSQGDRSRTSDWYRSRHDRSRSSDCYRSRRQRARSPARRGDHGDRSRSRDRWPSSTDRSRSREKGRQARRDQQEGVETVEVSQAPAVSEAPAGATPVETLLAYWVPCLQLNQDFYKWNTGSVVFIKIDSVFPVLGKGVFWNTHDGVLTKTVLPKRSELDSAQGQGSRVALLEGVFTQEYPTLDRG